MRTLIGLLIAAALIVVLCVALNNFLEDYLIDDGDWPPSLDWERFLYDMANRFVDHLYESETLPVESVSVTALITP